jgi:hypothetical protein
MNMTKLNSEIRELNDQDLNAVAGGSMRFYGMNCSVNQNNGIGAMVDALGSVPLVGGFLAAVGTAIGQQVCS